MCTLHQQFGSHTNSVFVRNNPIQQLDYPNLDQPVWFNFTKYESIWNIMSTDDCGNVRMNNMYWYGSFWIQPPLLVYNLKKFKNNFENQNPGRSRSRKFYNQTFMKTNAPNQFFRSVFECNSTTSVAPLTKFRINPPATGSCNTKRSLNNLRLQDIF